jgi:xanthine dehydrogenase accessory factor
MDAIRRLVKAVDAGETCVLATVTAVRGSAPRGPGARLLLTRDGTRTGTVGGGEVEGAALAAAREMLSHPGDPARTLEVDSGCGGNVTVFLERFGSPCRLLVVGAGHVGWAVAECAARSGFAVTLVDRPGASKSPPVPDISVHSADGPAALPDLAVTSDTQIVVATGSHQSDADWALAALATPCAGVGVVGSRSKARNLREAAQLAGIGAERLSVLRCPVGLDLGGVTPAEIAVAVVAELVLLARRGVVPAEWRKPSQV